MNTSQNVPAAGTEYSIEELPRIQLGSTVYRVEVQTFHTTGGTMTWLYGPRGAAYFLRGFLYRGKQVDTGERQVISFKSGAPLRVKGNEVRVTHLGDMLEQYVPAPRP